MGCKECGKPKCNGECGCKSPKVLQINNPAEYITFHKVSIPAAMGDSTTNPPKIGAYRNALVYYEADHTSWMYSTDGIPTLVTGEQGETGPQGPAGTIAVGTTITGEPGTDAEVENVGTPENAILNFTIPRGEQGDQGVQGEQGAQGPAGTNGVDGISPTATVVRTQNGATITITDAQGTTTADIYDGSIANIPIASSTVLGAIKVGSNLSITEDGTLSADAQQVTLYPSTGQNTDGAMTQKATTGALALKADSSSLAPVATSGDYNDLNNLPTPPTVNNGALTIQQNGTTVDTFTANSSADKTVNIETITAETVAPAEEVGAVTASMIDWESFAGNIFLFSGGRTTDGSFTTLPPGKYFLSWHARFATSGTEGWVNVDIRHGGKSFGVNTANCYIVNDGHTPVVSDSGVLDISAAEEITLVTARSGSVILQSCRLHIWGIKY